MDSLMCNCTSQLSLREPRNDGQVSAALADRQAMGFHRAFNEHAANRKSAVAITEVPKLLDRAWPVSNESISNEWSRLGQRLITLGQ
jgi:hypothetical protein